MSGHALLTSDTRRQANPIRVVIADDSTVARAMIGWTLEQAGMEIVATASNGRDAITAMRTFEADVLILDLEMPQMDGLSALPELLSASSAAVLVVSSLTTDGARSTIEALRLGASDTLEKPNAILGGTGGRNFGELLVERVEALSRSRRFPRAEPDQAEMSLPAEDIFDFAGPLKIIAVAASTGGPTAMFDLFTRLDSSINVPILVTQHLPVPFVPVLAEHLARHAQRPALVAIDGQRLQPGAIHIAPGTAHLRIDSYRGNTIVRLDQAPAPSGCRPSADPMFESVAEHFGDNAVAVVLSGMGRDGALGAFAVRQRGGAVIAQDATSSVVWGMPGTVCKNGTAHLARPPSGIASFINALARTRS